MSVAMGRTPCDCGFRAKCGACKEVEARALRLQVELEREGFEARHFWTAAIGKFLPGRAVKVSLGFGCLGNCGKAGRVRGLCPGCFSRLRRRVMRKELTWAEAEQQGLVRQAKKRTWNSLPVEEVKRAVPSRGEK